MDDLAGLMRRELVFDDDGTAIGERWVDADGEPIEGDGYRAGWIELRPKPRVYRTRATFDQVEDDELLRPLRRLAATISDR